MMRWLHRFATKRLVRAQSILLRRIQLADAEVVWHEKNGRPRRAAEWAAKRDMLTGYFLRTAQRIEEALDLEAPRPASVPSVPRRREPGELEFDCEDCGKHVIMIVDDGFDYYLCAVCRFLSNHPTIDKATAARLRGRAPEWGAHNE